jgi:hypothetical protein
VSTRSLREMLRYSCLFASFSVHNLWKHLFVQIGQDTYSYLESVYFINLVST